MARTSLKLSWRRENASGEAVSFHGVITVAACRAVLWCKKAQIGKERRACPSKTLRATEVRSNPRASARKRFEKKLSLGGQRQVSQKKSGIRTQESGVAGVAEYASKVFIRKSGTGICPGKSPPESQIAFPWLGMISTATIFPLKMSSQKVLGRKCALVYRLIRRDNLAQRYAEVR